MPLDALIRCLRGRPLFVLVGAGCSTESGIPDYRSRGIVRPPLEHRAFVADPAVRRRYWARSFHGWPRICQARPNPAHRALADLEQAGITAGPVTQNVDGLHHVAGSHDVIELHGALRDVVCLECGAREPRDQVQRRMVEANGPPSGEVEHRPDGDARATVEAAYARLDAAGAVLVVGSSLTVFSGYRFVKRAAERGLPVAIVNRGPTRADPLASVAVDGFAGEVLPALAAALREAR